MKITQVRRGGASGHQRSVQIKRKTDKYISECMRRQECINILYKTTHDRAIDQSCTLETLVFNIGELSNLKCHLDHYIGENEEFYEEYVSADEAKMVNETNHDFTIKYMDFMNKLQIQADILRQHS